MRNRVLLAVVAAATMGLIVAPLTASASSHREAPLIAEDPLADNTDLYAFVAPDDPNRTVIVANYVPFENPAAGPHFYLLGEHAASPAARRPITCWLRRRSTPFPVGSRSSPASATTRSSPTWAGSSTCSTSRARRPAPRTTWPTLTCTALCCPCRVAC